MSSALPTIPQYLFGVAEPTILILAFIITSLLPEYYVSSLPKLASSWSLLLTKQISIYQMSTLFLLSALLSIRVLNSIDDVKVARAFMTALWNMGSRILVVRGNIGISTFLFTMRTLYFLGVFGSDVNANY
ncbi:hypothetical protein BKA66DRAFT_605725 [Pyrenochaeta sp. MPI-SDFR-AT-0127]|nr:hypothetical protein BKA66DRAFT_605725 [Pyrenochaeta sp. MPI-SDFR-AT-0127]